MWYWSVAFLFWQLSIDYIVNVQCTRCGFTKAHLRHSSLPFDSFPYPTRIICRRVRTYARSVTWQPNKKRLTIFHEYGALSHARFARGIPAIIIVDQLIAQPSIFHPKQFGNNKGTLCIRGSKKWTILLWDSIKSVNYSAVPQVGTCKYTHLALSGANRN